MDKDFWIAALVRAAHTFCQAAVAAIGTAMLLSEVDWRAVLSASAMAAIVSLLKSIAVGLPEVDR